MTQSVRDRKPKLQRTVSFRPAPPPRPRRPAPSPSPRKKRGLTRRYAVLLLAMTYGCTIALLVVGTGFTTFWRDGTAVTGDASVTLQRAGSGSADGHDHANHGQKPTIEIEAQHVGNYLVNIKAKVSMNKDKDALTQAKVVAYTDMVQMPGVHSQGPVPLEEPDGNPGTYEGNVTVQMPGDYTIRVVVQDPVQGEKKTTIPVKTTY